MITSECANVEPITRSAHARIEFADPKVEPSLQALSVINAVDLICHLWQHYVNVALFPLAAASVTIRREMSVFNNQAVSRVEGAGNNLLQRLIDGMFDQDFVGMAIHNKSSQPSFPGYLCNSENKRRMISSLGTTTNPLPESTRSHVMLVARFWTRFEMSRFKI
jgi:hypothetical protein